MKILGFKIQPDKSHIAEVQVPVGSEILGVIIPKSQHKIIGAEPIDLQPMINVGIPDEHEDLEMVTAYIQIVTTEASIEGSRYLDSIWWSGSLYHLFAGFK